MIDKSIRQHYQNGERVDPYRKGLEMIAGKGKGAFQTTVPDKITAKSLIQPTEKMTLPSVKASKAAPFIRTLPTITQPSLDSAQYSGLENILPKTEEGSFLDKYIDRAPVRIVERAAKAEPPAYPKDVHPPEFNYLTSSLVGTDKATTSSDIDDILAPLAQISNEGATAFNDNQIENILKSEDKETKNLITSTIGTVNDTIKNNPLLKTGTDLVINTTLKNTVAKQLGIGSMFGPLGMLFSWAFDKVVSKIKGEETKGPINTLIDKAISKDEGDTVDRGFVPTTPIYSNPNEDRAREEAATTQAAAVKAEIDRQQRERDVAAAAKARAAAAPVYSSPARPHGGGNGGNNNSRSGSSSQSNSPGHPSNRARGGRMAQGGRIDKPFTGRSRDI